MISGTCWELILEVFGGVWRSPGTILTISEGIGKSLEFHWILWSGWLAPEPRKHGQRSLKHWSPRPLRLANNQLASSKIEYFKIVICKTWSLEGIVRLQAVKIETLKGIDDCKICFYKSYSSQPGGPQGAGGLYMQNKVCDTYFKGILHHTRIIH